MPEWVIPIRIKRGDVRAASALRERGTAGNSEHIAHKKGETGVKWCISKLPEGRGHHVRAGTKRRAIFDAPGTQVVNAPTSPLLQSLWRILAIYAEKCSVYNNIALGGYNQEALKILFCGRNE
jgi:hypothetical protein